MFKAPHFPLDFLFGHSQQQHIHIRTATTDVTAEAGSSRGGTTTVIYHGRKDRRGTISVEVETQTSRSSVGSMKVGHWMRVTAMI